MPFCFSKRLVREKLYSFYFLRKIRRKRKVGTTTIAPITTIWKKLEKVVNPVAHKNLKNSIIFCTRPRGVQPRSFNTIPTRSERRSNFRNTYPNVPPRNE